MTTTGQHRPVPWQPGTFLGPEHPGAKALIRPTRPRLSDVVLAGIALLLTGPLMFGTGFGQTAGATGAVMAALASVAMPVALAWRRSHPAASAAVVYGAALMHFAVGVPVIPADVLIFVSLYAVTVYGALWARRAGIIGVLLGCALQAFDTMRSYGGLTQESIIAGVMMLMLPGALAAAVWALALVRKARVQRLESFAERALRLEIERDQQAQIATADERARIAREMHDVVAHSLSVVIAQADGGRYAAAHDPRAAESALATIAQTGRTALGDLRRILGVLRSDEHGATGAAELIPQPAERDLDALVAQVQQAGLDVTLHRTGPPQPVPAAIGLSVYRIVQESLTNVLKHAGPQVRAQVTVAWQPTAVQVTVADDGHGAAAAPGGGHGLVGMRERATMLGGTLTAGPHPSGGWAVHAMIPLSPPQPTQEMR